MLFRLMATEVQLQHRSIVHEACMKQCSQPIYEETCVRMMDACRLSDTTWSPLSPVQAIVTAAAAFPAHRRGVTYQDPDRTDIRCIDVSNELLGAHAQEQSVCFRVASQHKIGSRRMIINAHTPRGQFLLPCAISRMRAMSVTGAVVADRKHPLVMQEVTFAGRQCERAKRLYVWHEMHRPGQEFCERLRTQFIPQSGESANVRHSTQWMNTFCHEQDFSKKLLTDKVVAKLLLTIFSGVFPAEKYTRQRTQKLMSELCDPGVETVTHADTNTVVLIPHIQDLSDSWDPISDYANLIQPLVVQLQCMFGGDVVVGWHTRKIWNSFERIAVKGATVTMNDAAMALFHKLRTEFMCESANCD